MTRLEHDSEDIFVEIVDLKDSTAEEVVVKNDDGSYTVFINARIAYERQQEALEHAMRHIDNNDFSKEDIQQIEAVAHQIAETVAAPTPQKKTREERLAENFARKRKRAIRLNHMTKAEKIRSLEGKIKRARLRMMEAKDEATYEKYKKKVWENEIRLNWLLDKDPFEDFR